MDEALLIARWQFGLTTSYHFIFVPLTIGLSVIVALMQTIYYRTEKEVYNEMTAFWGRLFVINVVLGVVTGIVLEFQFGMNWSEYSRFVGDIFGIPLAVEALLAFFVESTFLAVWIFGKDRLPRAIHLLSIWLVAIAASLSAVWILMAGSWMQRPVGYQINEGRAEIADFVAIMLNQRLIDQASHVIFGSFVTAGLFVVGISSWHLLRGHKKELFSFSAKLGLLTVFISGIAVATTGHAQAQNTAVDQPMKMAAMEALWETEEPASFSLFAQIDQENNRSHRELNLPYLLSVLAHNNTTDPVSGINDLQKEMEVLYGPGDYRPNVFVVYWAFRIMVGLGFLFIFFALYGLYLWWRGKLEESHRFHKVAIFMLFMPFVANTSGWIVTEMGRQPWVAYGLLKTVDGLSPSVGAGSVWLTTILFTTVYGVLLGVFIFLIYRFARPDQASDNGDDMDLMGRGMQTY